MNRLQIPILLCILAYFTVWSHSAEVFIPNLSESCFRCLCHVSTKCNQSYGCVAVLISFCTMCRDIRLAKQGAYVSCVCEGTLNGGEHSKRRYCGPFKISRVYWIDAGNVTLPDDDPERNRAWEDCARNYYCAQRIVRGYLQRFGKDCNGNGVTDCFDYMMVNTNGGYGCTAPLDRSENGRARLALYEECRLSL